MSINNATLVALSYVKKFSGMRLLIKLGGSILDDEKLIGKLCTDLSLIRAAGITVIIVHGGGKAINTALKTYNIPSTFHEGLRITTPEIMQIVEMVLKGQINSLLVRTLNAVGVGAIGLSGVDAELLLCEPLSEIHQCVGKVIAVNTTPVETILATQSPQNLGIIPVIAPVGIGANGQVFNVNADWAAIAIATALKIPKLIYLTDQDGIYDHQGQLTGALDAGQLEEFIKNETVRDGMLTKVKTILSALEQGIDDVHIINAAKPHALIDELFTTRGIGTVCRRKSNLYELEAAL